MANYRLAKPRTLFGWVFWLALGVGIFTWLYFQSGPSPEVARQISAAGPDRVTAFFQSPEASVSRINELIASRNWTRLARYYDFSMSHIPRGDVVSGAYFIGGDPALPEGAMPKPFPSGYRFVYSEPTDLDDIYQVVVEGSPPDPTRPGNAPRMSFFLRAEPDGYRVLPDDAIARLKATAANR